MKRFLLLLICGLALAVSAAPKKLAPIISAGRDGRLVYDADTNGDRVPDFSTCGYAGANRLIPMAAVQVVVPPISGDETARIQRALDYVAALPPDTNGLRGAVLLPGGRHQVFGGLFITNSGVILRGQGTGAGGTTLVAAGLDRRTLIHVQGRNDVTVTSNLDWVIADARVPVGATSFHVKDGSGLKIGDTVRIVRPSTKEWIDLLGMTEFGGGIGDWRLVWKPGSRDVVWDRVVQKVDGNLVTVDSALTTAMDSNYGGGWIEACLWPGRIQNIGVENLSVESECDLSRPKDEDHAWFAITMDNVMDAWVRQVAFSHFAGSAVAIYEGAKRVTVEDCISSDPVSEDAGWRRNTFYTMGQQTLFLRCYAEHGRHDFAVGHAAAGPNAFVDCEAELPSADSGAIGSWSCGTLFDNVRIDGGGLSLKNRGSGGEGAGWSAANSVLWQCSASEVACENPPGARNFAFGCWGEFEGNGVWRNANASVKPVSLYAAQLGDRLGPAAARRVVLMARSLEEYSNPTPEQAAKLIEESQRPAPSLKDFIAAAGRRDPVSTGAGTAKSVDELPDLPARSAEQPMPVRVTNGWLVCNGRLVTGTTLPVNWWRGNMLPCDAKNYGVNLTRFAPGREGPGYTDDLEAVADLMQAGYQVALDHHYGLWYDRRREDHERVRRITGDVWAPFYEQPFARSGTGTAWDGLSQYDLTKYNVWYWSRLNQFAAICDRRGLVLFNENYFQHNILEAGAHWVDCPWRSANNINSTDFPEPPPFAGDKRIFMAEQFYDVSNPVRRELHREFIRQNLANFTNRANVIQFTSAEFTGPLAFEQFWLDTIRDWEAETDSKPLVALCATKNVQDAILADDRRAQTVNIICLRYWWQTDGDLFAPDGGRNLSPRQFERQWRSGTPSDEDLAAMAAEYRGKFSGKAVIASGEDEDLNHGAWAFVCAGGSMPSLPASTDAQLLEAIPQMQPWPAATGNGRWALRNGRDQMLVYSGESAGVTLDLSAESGAYVIGRVNPHTGAVTWLADVVQGGSVVNIPNGVVWLKRR